MLVSRNSFEETVNFIVQDLERATELLPEVQPDKNGAGATKGAALALKTRVLLHAASDLYNKNPENELVGYTSGDQQQRWRAAKDRKSTRLNSSHVAISYAVFCLKKKKRENKITVI